MFTSYGQRATIAVTAVGFQFYKKRVVKCIKLHLDGEKKKSSHESSETLWVKCRIREKTRKND